jgi:anti-sigma B factor antagonist
MTAREAPSFTLTVHRRAVVVEARGELDVVSAPAFRAAMAEAAATGRPLVVVDMARVQFVDSAGLAVVFGAQRMLPVSQRMTLANVPERMHRMLRLAAVDAVVDVHSPGQPQPWLEED